MFIETSTFTRELPRHFDDDAYDALQAFLGAHREAGDLIRGTSGIRKNRWTMPGRGKRGGSQRRQRRPDPRRARRVAKGRGGNRQ